MLSVSILGFLSIFVSVTSLNSPTNYPTTSAPLVLTNLPTPAIDDGLCPRRARMQIDLLLLAIEALLLGGSEAILATVNELELQEVIKNRVMLWQLRSTNPLRRYGQRRSMTLTEAKALVAIAANLSQRVVVIIRQLLIDYQQLRNKQIPIEQHLKLADYLERFRAHFRSRMNPRRVTAYASNEALDELAMSLLSKLLFCTGTFGMQRFWISLFDGEVE